MIADPEPREASAVDILVRNLEKETVDELKRLAREHGRSLQAEVKEILERQVQRRMTMAEFRDYVRSLGPGLGRPDQEDSVDIIRRMREERSERWK